MGTKMKALGTLLILDTKILKIRTKVEGVMALTINNQNFLKCSAQTQTVHKAWLTPDFGKQFRIF